MGRQIVSVHTGQCGNQIGQQFWRSMCAEHAIGPDGRPSQEPLPDDDKLAFFYQADDAHYVPRAVLVDLEPRVINGVLNSEFQTLFNRESILMSQDGGGAGNNWAAGYAQADALSEQLSELLAQQAEQCDSLEGFNVTHAISGGTGSGLGSYMLEMLADSFPKKLITAFSVFANQEEGSSADVVVQPYNSVLTLRRLSENASCVVVLDNSALHRIAGDRFRTQTPSFDHINQLVARIMSTMTASIRYPWYANSRMVTLLGTLIAYQPLHFLQTGFTPITEPGQNYQSRSTIGDVMRRLLQPNSLMITTRAKRDVKAAHCMITATAIFQGEHNFNEMTATLAHLERNRAIRRPPWLGYSPLSMVEARSSPYLKSPYRVSGLLLANQTNSSLLFENTLDQYRRLRSKNAFLDRFTRETGFEQAHMDEAAESVEELRKCYEAATRADFLEG